MQNVLFRQSEVQDPFAIYAQMLIEHPVYFDSANKIWAVYAYAACQQLLNAEFVYIPDPNQAVISQMSESAQSIARHLIRLQNSPRHGVMRPLVLRLFEQARPVDPRALLNAIFSRQERAFDWVAVVAQRMPAQVLLASFGFSPDVAENLLQLLDFSGQDHAAA